VRWIQFVTISAYLLAVPSEPNIARMNEPSISPIKKRGRKLSFDRDAALKSAMHTFWRHGYETTSVSDLLGAMNISAPSLYTAFGDKERLFMEVVQLYVDTHEQAIVGALDGAPTAKDAIDRFLQIAVTGLVKKNCPKGCLLVTAAPVGSTASLSVQLHLAQRRNHIRKLLEGRIKRGILQGDVPGDVDAASLSYFYSTVFQGMSIQACGGAKRRMLSSIASQSLLAWPDAK